MHDLITITKSDFDKLIEHKHFLEFLIILCNRNASTLALDLLKEKAEEYKTKGEL